MAELGSDVLVALFVDLPTPLPQGIECLVALVLLVVGQTEEIVEHHLLGVVFHGRLRRG